MNTIWLIYLSAFIAAYINYTSNIFTIIEIVSSILTIRKVGKILNNCFDKVCYFLLTTYYRKKVEQSEVDKIKISKFYIYLR